MANFKRGDTFVRTFQIANGNVASWSEWQGRAQIRSFFADGALLAELDFTWIDTDAGIFTISTNATENFPTGKHYYDIEISNAETKFSSETKTLIVEADVTKDDA